VWFDLVTTVAAMLIAVRGNVTINRLMDHWSPAAPPAGWEQVRARWLAYHRLRGIAEIAGFIALLVAALLYVSTSEGFSLSRSGCPTKC
jgi:hypothetical protein